MRAGRILLAVLAGAAVWAALWVGGTQAVASALSLAPDEPLTRPGVLLGYVLYSVILSVLAGFVSAVVAGIRPIPAVWTLAIIQLAIGVFVEISYWNLMPVWYHLVFLALIVPATVYGGRRRARGRA